MSAPLEQPEEILRCHVPGFHQYELRPPFHLSYVSDSLCAMTGYAPGELLCGSEDRYASLVHSAHRPAYHAFLERLARDGGSGTLVYHLVRKDGAVLSVSDTLSTRRREDGSLAGFSVLTPLPDNPAQENLAFLNDTVPCGFMKYTCEEQPRVTYINRRMLEMLRFPDVGSDWALYRDNIYLMIPPEERRRFALYLGRVCAQGVPLAGDMTLLRRDGSKGHFFGWVTKTVNHRGEAEFQSVCVDVSERHDRKRELSLRRYTRALTDVYESIFAYDLSAQTVTCLHSPAKSLFSQLENIPMQMRDATQKWVESAVSEEDRPGVLAFFSSFWSRMPEEETGAPPQIRYRAPSSQGREIFHTGIFLKIDSFASLFCCRSQPEAEETALLQSEIASLKHMQEMVMHFTDGIAAFEVSGDLVTPLYASDNVCHFFGYTKEEWLPLMKAKTPLRKFVSRSGTTLRAFEDLFRNGEAEFTYFDFSRQTDRRVKAICSRQTADTSEPRYVMMYRMTGAGEEGGADRVTIRTFGYFDVFAGGRTVAFRSQKSKELLALLVDRRGGFISSDEAICYLWPEEPSSAVTLSRYRKVALRLKSILEEYGISQIVESVDGKRRIVSDKVQCDLYDYLSGHEGHRQLFKGSYLTNYSWGEATLAELLGENFYGKGLSDE